MNSNKEKISYCIGLETGKNLSRDFADVDHTSLSQGLKDGLQGATPKLSNQEIISILTALRNQLETQQKKYLTELAQSNKSKGDAFLQENKNTPGVITLASGLQYKVMKSGSGAMPTLFDDVTIHYKGSLIDGTVFDSSFDRGQPQTFPLNKLIAGWSEALQLMKVGDSWQLFIPSYLAYGEHGFGPDIGPNSALIFEVELIGINAKK